MKYNSKYLIIILTVVALAKGVTAAEKDTYTETRIDDETRIMADDSLNLRPMLGFDYLKMTLPEAEYWHGKMAEYLGKKYGKTVGYKTGGHNIGPTFATFPKDGIRGLILEKMLLPNNSYIRVDSTMRGFLEADFAFRVKDDSINKAEK